MLRALHHAACAAAALAGLTCLLAALPAPAQRGSQSPAPSTDRLELFPRTPVPSSADLIFTPGQSFADLSTQAGRKDAPRAPTPKQSVPSPAGVAATPAEAARPMAQSPEPDMPPLAEASVPAQPGGNPAAGHLHWQQAEHPLVSGFAAIPGGTGIPPEASMFYPLVPVPPEAAAQGVQPAAHRQPPAGVERSALTGAPIASQPAMPIAAAFGARQEELPAPAPPEGQIILMEEPGMVLGPTCFECPNCGGPGCYPGRPNCCSVCTANTRWGRFWCAIYETICCPDPCWEPTYLPIADSAFFVPTARPTTMSRFRWDAGFSMVYPDRAEFFWAQANGSGLGPQPVAPYKGERGLDYDELSMYTEAAVNNFALTFEMPYRSVDPLDGSIEAGFSDMIIGTKSLFFDRELIQVAFQFRTFIPSGKAMEGLGTGHTSLEPSLIVGFKISPESYLQAQIAEWIPMGASSYAGSILHYHVAYNQTLFYMLPDVPIIGSAEFNGWSFQDGSYTDPYRGQMPANDHTYLSGALGVRMFMCNMLDMGMSANFAFGSPNWTQELYRLECRLRF